MRGRSEQLSLGLEGAPGDRGGHDADERVWRVGSRVLQTTPVFDTYWRFAAERQEILFRRLDGSGSPWTSDPILARHKFTNAYRSSDRVSQYLIAQLLYRGSRDPAEVVFRVLLFKLFNRIETWQLLQHELGTLTWENYDYARYDRVLSAAMRRGERIYSAAYIVPPPPFGMARKHQNHLRLIEHMMTSQLPERLVEASNLKTVYELLRSYPSVGPFLAYQLAIDLNYSTVVHHDEMEFVVPGPGAIDGITKCFADTGGLDAAEIIRWVTETASEHFERLGLAFRDLWGRPLQLIDCQNLFCETDKYARAAHPEVVGRRSRIKQRFVPNARPLAYRYPPKWQLPTEVTAELRES